MYPSCVLFGISFSNSSAYLPFSTSRFASTVFPFLSHSHSHPHTRPHALHFVITLYYFSISCFTLPLFMALNLQDLDRRREGKKGNDLETTRLIVPALSLCSST